MRPLIQLEQQGVSFARIPCGRTGELFTGALRSMTKTPTKAICMTHASNVCGTLLPIQEVGHFCREHGIYFIVDAAQTAGLVPIDMEEMCIDALCFTAHKGMLGPQGIGGVIVTDALAQELVPLISGGTDSKSHTEDIPDFLPDMLEAGTPNLPGIAGWHAALEFLRATGAEQLRAQTQALTGQFLKGIQSLPNVRPLGLLDTEKRTGVVSVQVINQNPADIAAALDANYGIAVCAGLQCAPNAHKTLGTYPDGTIRFSFGYFNTQWDVEAAVAALAALTGLP
jgi:selenocysteine lyase/cysteine desulfurase